MSFNITYSNVTKSRGALSIYLIQAFIKASSGYFLLIGTISFLNASLGACRDIASDTGQSSRSLSIAGIRPLVDKVTLLRLNP